MSASFFQTSNRWHTPDRHSLSDNIVWISTFCMSWYLSQEHTYRQKSDWSYLPKDSKCSPCCSRRNRNRQGMACLEHNRPDSFLKLKSIFSCKSSHTIDLQRKSSSFTSVIFMRRSCREGDNSGPTDCGCVGDVGGNRPDAEHIDGRRLEIADSERCFISRLVELQGFIR